MTLENVYSVREDDITNWQTKVKVTIKFATKTLNFRLDTGTDVTVVPDRYFITKKKLIHPTNKRLNRLCRHEMNIGSVEATLYTEKTSLQQNLYVVENLKDLLLGGPAIKALNLL